jgi:hypothetical protein
MKRTWLEFHDRFVQHNPETGKTVLNTLKSAQDEANPFTTPNNSQKPSSSTQGKDPTTHESNKPSTNSTAESTTIPRGPPSSHALNALKYIQANETKKRKQQLLAAMPLSEHRASDPLQGTKNSKSQARQRLKIKLRQKIEAATSAKKPLAEEINIKVESLSTRSSHLFSGSDMILHMLLLAVLCRSPLSIGRYSTTVHRTLLPFVPPRTLQGLFSTVSNKQSKTVYQGASSSTASHSQPSETQQLIMIPIPTFEYLAYPLLIRLRLWSLHHTRDHRKASTWPTREELEDMEVLLAALTVCRLPEALSLAARHVDMNSILRQENNSSSSSSKKESTSSSTTGPSNYFSSVLQVPDDIKALKSAEEWNPYPEKCKATDPNEVKKDKDPTARPAEEWIKKSRISETQAIVHGNTLNTHGLIQTSHEKFGGVSALKEKQKHIPGVVVIHPTVDDEKKVDAESEEDARKREQEVQIKQYDVENANRGRLWITDVFSPETFMAEVDAILHALLLQEYMFIIAGVVVDQRPTITDHVRNTFDALLLEKSQINSGDDSWDNTFRKTVFEYCLPLGARTISKRSIMKKEEGAFVSTFFEQQNASVDALTVYQNELGLHSAESVERMLTASSENKAVMAHPSHELNDVFTIHFFSHILFNMLQGQFTIKREPARLDFCRLYVLTSERLESEGKDLLLNRNRDNMLRRPLVVDLCKKWLVHDFMDIKERDQQQNFQRMMERKYEDDTTENSSGRSMGHSVYKQVGIWYECDSSKEACLLWIHLVMKYYNGQLENLIHIAPIAKALGIEV